MVYIYGLVSGIVIKIKSDVVTLLQKENMVTINIRKVPALVIDNIADGEIVTFKTEIITYLGKDKNTYLLLNFIENL